ncbi:aminotransferase class V-fold PLP-dependent enzyme [Alkalihalobacillus sp. TS-13]|uniref:aminotransferase class V-fold PLP-dependent enzyme n=1 Tax=Alkalihalobacillus sp. TS-13 TaxID=2842455 RepID=UPI001C88C5BB|nr:aminotransferase class V-fold PLP-dependent enzyme [Alkalihalobacillus sp. TS-13]
MIEVTTLSRFQRLEQHFSEFKSGIIGRDHAIFTPYGKKKLLYADWTASGRLYTPIEETLVNKFGPFVANTHTESNITGQTITNGYHQALKIIKQHVNAYQEDVILTSGTGMTDVVNKFQRILGLKLPPNLKNQVMIADEDRPVIFVTHMEHHSNHTSWLETIGEVVVIPPDEQGRVSVEALTQLLIRYKNRKMKIASITACSNVTGIITPYHRIAKVMHEHGGLCFVDFSCSAPYVKIEMHPEEPMEKLDAIFFSPHKFLGGPGTCGVLVFDSSLYSNDIPDHSGGGTVSWTNPWGGRKYVEDIQSKEDGGTPGFIQAIRTALAIKLKEKMGITNMLLREEELLERLFTYLKNIPNIYILDEEHRHRIGVVSFYIEDIHHNLVVRILNDRYGIQVRGGCSCAGTYGHYLLNIDQKTSKNITDQIDTGNSFIKPGWVRVSLHPTMTDHEIDYIGKSIKEIAESMDLIKEHYRYIPEKNDFLHVDQIGMNIESWFNI